MIMTSDVIEVCYNELKMTTCTIKVVQDDYVSKCYWGTSISTKYKKIERFLWMNYLTN